jgi:hypothetical protein
MNFQRPPSVPLHIVGKLALGILFLHSLPQGLQAESGRLTRLPVSQAFLPNKITLEIDARWAAGNGYRPVRCTITRPGGPATADRSFRIILEPSTGQYRHFQPQVEGLIELKRGQRSAQIDLYCPQSYWWNSIQVQMYEGSKELREMRRSTAGVIGGRTAWSEAVPSLLFVSSAAGRTTVQLARETKFPNWDRIATTIPGYPSHVYNQNSYSVAKNDLAVHTVIANQPRTALVLPQRLPNRWLGLSTIDFVFISVDDLALLHQNYPQKIEALKQWVEVGGNLCVEDVGMTYESVPQVELYLGLTSTGPHAGNWTSLSLLNCEPFFREGLRLNVPGYTNPTYKAPNQNLIPPRVQSVAMGRVFVIADGTQWSHPSFAPWIFNSLPQNRWAWYQRNGMTQNRQNNDFWNWSVRGIGRPPIYLFLAVISVFSVVIGPINFFVMKRWNRYYLLLVTVPIISLFTTISLFGYGLLKDGIGTTVRRRAYVHLDQTSGRMQTWSRQTYYASLAPYGGLQFPLNAAVYPILLDTQGGGRQSSNPNRIQWAGSQHLRRGYIGSRTLSQFLVIQPTKSTAANIAFSTSDGKLAARNELGGRIAHLLVCDEHGQLHSASGLSVGETETLKPTDGQDIASNIRDALVDTLTPEVEQGLVRSNNFYWYYNEQIDQNLPEADDESSLMEQAIAEVRGDVVQTLTPRTYVAIMPSSSFVSKGVAQAKDRDSVIVVRGRW